MKKSEVMNKFSRSFKMTGLKIKKHSPEILIVAGVVGTVTSAVMACRATTKLDAVLSESKQKIESIHHYTEHPEELPEGAEYTAEDSKKDLAIVYAQTGFELVKLYAPSVILGTLSITAILTSNKILRKRNVALAAAYATVDKSFKEYRGRVVERFGKQLDRELRYNIKAQEIEETVMNEDGTESTVTKTVNVIDPNTIDDSSRIWYEGNPGWSKDPEFNLMYLKKQQAFATEKLKTDGYLLLNDVYEILGYAKTSLGYQLGWIYDKKKPIGDNFVDFGIYDIHDPLKAKFLAGYETSILLEFNHDGYILDKI